jgi:MFS family permease
MLLGTLLLVGVVMSLVSARLTLVALLAFVVAMALRAVSDGAWRQAAPPPDAIGLSLAALLVFALASTLWAEAGSKAIPKVLQAAAFAAGALFVARLLQRQGRTTIERCAEGLWIGLAVGLAYLLIEAWSSQAIQIAVYNLLKLPREMLQPERHFTWDGDTITAIKANHINRNFAVATLLLFPAALAAYATLPPPRNRLVAALLVAATFGAALSSRHESSMAALAAGLGVLLLAWRWPGGTRNVLMAAWVIACLGVVPASLLAHKLEWHRHKWLHHSLRHRVIIWNHTAEQTLKSPVVGIGAYMTYVLGPKLNEETVSAPGEAFQRTLSRHAHNVYLQTWFELGAIGAALLMASGLSILGAIGRVQGRAAPFALATFATAATMMAASYGIWQTWYLALYALTAVVYAVGARASELGKTPA